MTSDLLFYVLPRLGKDVPVTDEHIVEKVSKEARLRALNDEEKELNTEEREAREKNQKSLKKKKSEQDALKEEHHPEYHSDHNYVDDKGQRHIDDFA